MKYDFTSVIDRTGKDSIAFDKLDKFPVLPSGETSLIPMWIADMNFATCPSVLKSMSGRLEHPLYGYFETRAEYFDSIISWQRMRHGTDDLKKEHIGYENGVLGGLASAIAAFTAPGEKILLNAPAYIGFISTIENLGRKAVYSNLVRDDEGCWRLDFEDMDRKLRGNNIHMVVFCSPHNPCGRVWEREELERLMHVLVKNDCLAVSDEIWSDIVFKGSRHIPLQSISAEAAKRTIALYSPAKTFNLAGIIGAYHIIYNRTINDRMTAFAKATHYNGVNLMSMYAQIGAYSEEGAVWTEELCEVLRKNSEYAYEHICDNYHGIKLAKPQGTYMMYLDCAEYCREHGCSLDELYARGTGTGVLWQDGRPFQMADSIRLNIALPETLLKEAFSRLDSFVL